MRPLFIVNPVAGRGAGTAMIEALRSAFPGPADMVETTGPESGARLAEQAALAGVGPVVAVGGDGTVMNVLNGLMRAHERPPLGIVPIGNGNDLARTLGVPKDVRDAVRRVWANECDPIDVGRCNDRYFLNVGGAGLDTDVAKSLARSRGGLLRGQAAYLAHGLSLISRYRNAELTICLDDERVVARSLLVAVANGRCFAGGMKICPDAEVDDGMFDVCIAGDLSRLEALTQVPMIYFGRHVRHPKVRVARARRVVIEGPDGMEVQLDGEVVARLPAVFEIVPGAIRIAGWKAGG